MTRSECMIACCMVALATLSLGVFLSGPPVMAQAATSEAAPTAVTASSAGEIPEMPEAEMTALNRFCKAVFYPVLHPIFKKINDLLLMIPDRAAGFCGVGLFLSAMLWVGLILNKDYVNRGRPYKSLATDLRIWTVISMTPHVLVYFYFR